MWDASVNSITTTRLATYLKERRPADRPVPARPRAKSRNAVRAGAPLGVTRPCGRAFGELYQHPRVADARASALNGAEHRRVGRTAVSAAVAAVHGWRLILV